MAADESAIQVDTRAIKRGMWAVVIGSLLSMVGIIMASSELATVARRYVQQMDTPPSELAKQGWSNARLAAAAGAAAGVEAWRQKGGPQGRASSNGGVAKTPAQTG